MEKINQYHIPALLNESLLGLDIKQDGIYVDVTFGGGGHSKAIYNQLNKNGKLFSFDQDEDAKKNIWNSDNFKFISSNFSYIKNHLYQHNINEVDGIIADLGVSFHQFDSSDRGFSIRTNEKLDMRMNQKSELSAFEVVNKYELNDLNRIFKTYGELSQSYRISQKIIESRQKKLIYSTFDLIEILSSFTPEYKAHKFFAKVFQAIRMEVNNELDNLSILLKQTSDLIKPGGRLVIISYHSLEDRLVKNFIKSGNIDGKIIKDFFGNVIRSFTEINKKPIIPSEDEIISNTRSRSAKLRIGIKNGK